MNMNDANGPVNKDLVALLVGQVLKKHDIDVDKNKLSPEEKKEIKQIVENIQANVEQFLVNQQKKKTEHDFNSPSNPGSSPSQENKDMSKRFQTPNDVTHAKIFSHQRRKD